MTDQAVVRTVRVTVAVGGGLAVAGSAVLAATGHAGFWMTEFSAHLALIAVASAVFAWVVIPRQPRNAAVWAMAASSLLGLYVAGQAAVSLLLGVDPSRPFEVPPAQLPASVAWTMAAATLGYSVGFNALVTFGFLLFPDGSLPSPRWRGVGWLAATTGLTFAVVYAVNFRPTNTGLAEEGALINNVVGIHLVATVLCFSGLVTRFRASHGATRQQFKWVVWGAGVFVPVFVATVLVGDTAHEEAALVPFLVAVAVLVFSYGVAVGRYRLYDIDLVISRTLVYGSLAVVVTSVYVAAVVGISRLLGADEPNTGVAIAATAGVAAAFHPLRRRFQRAADRLVYGRTVTPHEVLSEFSRHLAAMDESVLERVARSLVGGTGADSCTVWLTVDGRLVEAAHWPEQGAESEGHVVSCPIQEQGVELGILTLSTSRGQHVSEQDRRLADHVASGLGLALRNRVLTRTLERRISELRDSRRRLVAARDEIRRKLERDLHDGAQQQLVALKVKLGLARALADEEGGSATAALLGRLAEHADEAVDTVRDFARGVYPPLLEAEGLGPAFTAQARRSLVPVSVDVRSTRRYPWPAEATVYFCVTELLQIMTVSDSPSAFHVSVHEDDATLTFEVVARGSSVHLERSLRDAGLLPVTERLDAADGTLDFRAEGDGVTSVRGSIPVEASAWV